jgi:hypothetical protein
MLKFATEAWTDVEAEIAVLAEWHWREMPYDSNIPLKIASEVYRRCHEAGELHVLTARDGTALVGYFVSSVRFHPHYGFKVAAMDAYFLLPTYRRGSRGLAFFSAMERELSKLGCKLLLCLSRLDNGGAARAILQHLEWNPTRTVWEKRLP